MNVVSALDPHYYLLQGAHEEDVIQGHVASKGQSWNIDSAQRGPSPPLLCRIWFLNLFPT